MLVVPNAAGVRDYLRRLTLPVWLTLAVLVGLCLLAAWHAQSYQGVVIDDAFITFRHSMNLLRGEGFSCNPGERVEGTSSPLFALIMALPIALGADPYPVAAGLGTLALIGLTIATYQTVRSCLQPSWSRLLGLAAAMAVAASSVLAFHSQTGLETLVYSWLLMLALLRGVRCLDTDKCRAGWAFVMGFAALTRPEGVVVFLVLLTTFTLSRLERPRVWHRALQELLRFAAIFVPWLLFRRFYFGEWLPNTVIAKGGRLDWLTEVPMKVAFVTIWNGPGVTLVVHFVQRYGLQVMLTLTSVLLSRTRAAGALVLSIFACCAATAVWNGGDWMPHYRLFAPCVAPLAVGMVLGLRGLLFHRPQRIRGGHWPSWLVTTLVLAMVVMTNERLPRQMAATKDLVRMRMMGEQLSKIRSDSEVVAADMAGILAYYWGTKTVDMYGLCNKTIARQGETLPFGVGKMDYRYVIAQRPTWYAFEFTAGAASLYRQPDFIPHRGEYYAIQFPYRYFGNVDFGPPMLLVRKDRPEVQSLQAALGVRLVDMSRELHRTGFLRHDE